MKFFSLDTFNESDIQKALSFIEADLKLVRLDINWLKNNDQILRFKQTYERLEDGLHWIKSKEEMDLKNALFAVKYLSSRGYLVKKSIGSTPKYFHIELNLISALKKNLEDELDKINQIENLGKRAPTYKICFNDKDLKKIHRYSENDPSLIKDEDIQKLLGSSTPKGIMKR